VTAMRIDVITGTRAEFGILQPLVLELQDSPVFNVRLLATGMHLISDFGNTATEVENSGVCWTERVQMYGDDPSDPIYYSKGLASGIEHFTQAYLANKPDLIVVLGDRMEPFAASPAAAPMKIAHAHIHGGDRTMGGHIDDLVRNAISAFSHIHFAATVLSKSRLLKMGEEPWRVHVVGALGLDSVLKAPLIPKAELSTRIELDLDEPTAICIFHPLNSEAELSGRQMAEILKALRSNDLQTVILYPNNDAGYQRIVEEIKDIGSDPKMKVISNLSHVDYVNLMRHSSFMIGNSSSGLIEAPSVGLPFINVGNRQEGREQGSNVIPVKPIEKEISEAIGMVLAEQAEKGRMARYENPFGNGESSKKIRAVLEKVVLDDRLLNKRMTY
jgi:GDP/UDP-N,N'-diacetylbacillosamine 2-epimerase (hydrolysing)